MARRLALLALLACAVPAHRHRHRTTLSTTHDISTSDSESLDPFVLFEDYDSYETTPKNKTSAKVILRSKGPKPVKMNTVEPEKKVIKSTTINVESYTNFVVTKRPQVMIGNSGNRVPQQPTGGWDGQYVWIEEPNMVPVASPTTRRPAANKRRTGTSTRRPTTTRRRPTSTRRPTTTRASTTYKPYKRKTTCATARPGYISSYFQNTLTKKTTKKPAQAGWFTGIIKNIYNWISKSTMSWLNSTKDDETESTVTTTAAPETTVASDWFQNLLDTEENDDGAYVTEAPNKKPKKSLKKNYKGYQLLRAYPDAQAKVRELLDLQEEGQGSGLMWWTSPSINGSTDIVVPPDLLEDVKDNLKYSKIDFDVVIWDLQKAISYENPKLSKKQRLELEQHRGHPLTWRRYHRYADMLRYIEYLQHSHSHLVELVPLGRSSEGLPLVAVKISLPSNETNEKDPGGKNKKWKLRSRMKPAVWVDAGAHAREWIAPAVATWMLHALVEGETGLGADYETLKQADFYIMPVLNPDGYEHSHTHDRLWMKTRSRFDRSDDYFVGWFPWNWGRTECMGVDTDRNWDHRWGVLDASTDPCADNYRGPHPFSEPETRAVSDFLTERRGQIKVYLTLHAYSQSWVIPSVQAAFADDGVLMEMGKLATAALSDLFGTKYKVGTLAEIKQPASGMPHDWAKARAGIQYAYHVDLRDSLGPYGFLLPGSQIVPTAKETWQAVKAIVDNLNPV